MAHTRGPWKRKDRKIGDRIYRIDIEAPVNSGHGVHPICSIYAGFTNMEDNACLIAAAPELEAENKRQKQQLEALSLDKLCPVVERVLKDYRCTFHDDGDGNGIGLSDMLARADDETVASGLEEIRLLAENVADEVARNSLKVK